MAKPAKVWRVVPPCADLAAELGKELDISPVVAQVLVNRGVADADAALRFLNGGVEALPDPRLMLGMDRAVERIGAAIAGGEKITVYGDYDVDGVTATSLLYRLLGRLGGVADYYIPERQSEGYGLNAAALEALQRAGTRLVITVDCGISAAAEVAALAGRMDIIVTDHHQPPAVLPPALAILNPKQPGCPYPDKNLAGVGVAFKLAQALWLKYGGGVPLADYLDLVATGTIADIVPLTGENRVLVKLGLATLASGGNPGLKALAKAAGLADGKVDAGRVGFGIAPRLNAAGRLGHAAAGVELLVTDDDARAAELAAELDRENGRRQAVEKELLAAAEAQAAGMDTAAAKVLVLAGEDWHPGVIGIVASRMVDRYYRPTVMISVKDGIGKGSCRSIPGFDIYSALSRCADLLIQFGGHQQAAGLTIDAANIDRLRERLSEIAAATLTADDYRPVLNIDCRVALDEIDAAFLQQLACLAPHGMGNPSPVFVCEDLAVSGVKPVGQEGRHLKLRVRRQRASGDVIGWDMGGLAGRLGGGPIDLAFAPEFNEWQGQRSIQLKAHDVRLHPVGAEEGYTAPAAPEKVKLADARGKDKEACLAAVLAAGGRTLITVNDRREAAKLTRRLRRDFPAGGRRFLVAAGNCAGAAIGFDTVVLYSLPPTLADLAARRRLAAAQAGSVALHFAYGPADVPDAERYLDVICPDRTAVGWVYLAMKQAAGADGAVALSDRQLARAAARLGGQPVALPTVAAGLVVLRELGLVASGDGARPRLLPAPARKLALEESPAFAAGLRARQEFPALARQLVRAPLPQLWKLAADGE